MSTSAAALPRTRTGRPKLRRTDDVLDYWVERIACVAPEREHFQYASMICESDSLFHYGRHFELARIMRAKRGRARLVLLNGDTYAGGGGFGPSTSSRQSDARNAVRRTGVPSLVVPFSALEGAGIDFKTISPIHVRDDRHTTEEHSSRQRPTTRPGRMPTGEMRTEKYYGYNSDGQWGEHEREAPVYVDDPRRTAPFSTQHGWCEDGAQLGDDGIWRWHVRRHWLGDSIFRARTTERRTRKATAEELAEEEQRRAWDAELRRLREVSRRLSRMSEDEMSGLREAQHEVARAIEAHYESQPRMRQAVRGDGRVPVTVMRWATFLSSFDYQEARPLYFLCELPYGAKPNTVQEAIEALKPPEVVAALARGLAVVRQGDLFAIPTKLTKRQIRRMRGKHDFTKRLRVLGTNHSVTEGIVCKGGAVLGRGVMRHEPEAWRPPDHAPQKLGDAWHLLVRNTVPRSQ